MHDNKGWKKVKILIIDGFLFQTLTVKLFYYFQGYVFMIIS